MHPLRPALLLCPALAAERSPAWRAPAHAALVAAGIPTLSPEVGSPIPHRGSEAAAGGPAAGASAPASPPGTAAVGADTAGEDRLALAAWVADLAIAIGQAGLREPLLLVAGGSAVRGLPALGFSQRAARHPVVGYVIVDGPPPPPSRSGQEWPDAPVTVIRSPGTSEDHARAARLRDWSVLVGDPAEVLVSLALAWPGPPHP